MLTPDFTQYSLALLDGDGLLYSVCGGGLRPLWEALEKFHGKTGLILHDRVTGLAAARLIARSGIIRKVFSMVASQPARDFLHDSGIVLMASNVTDNILRKDKSALCPGEVIAHTFADPSEFTQKIKEFLGFSISADIRQTVGSFYERKAKS
jgi:hypothetical protein